MWAAVLVCQGDHGCAFESAPGGIVVDSTTNALNELVLHKQLEILEDRDHPSFRHSITDWSDPKDYMRAGYDRTVGIDTIVRTGEVSSAAERKGWRKAKRPTSITPAEAREIHSFLNWN